MSDSILSAELFVSGQPIPKARPRVTNRTTKKGFPITYTPKSTVQWERLIAEQYRRQCAGIFFERRLPLKFYAEIICPGTGPVSSIRGDADNYCKSIFDALNTVAFDDDAQVIDARIVKRRAHKGEATGAYLLIEVAGPIQPELVGGFKERQRRASVMPWETVNSQQAKELMRK